MFSHILKLIWNRKRNNALMITEIAIAFIVVLMISVLAVSNYRNYQVPLGYEWQDHWQISLGISGGWSTDTNRETLRQMIAALKSQEAIDSVGVVKEPLFFNSVWQSSTRSDDRLITFNANTLDDEAFETLSVNFLAGRAFDERDNGQGYRPVIVNQLFVDTYFSNGDALDKLMPGDNANGGTLPRKIIGIVEEFRQYGELAKPVPYVISRFDIATGHQPSAIVIKVKEGTDINYEQHLSTLLKGIAPEWHFSFVTLKSQRSQSIENELTPLIVLSIVALFFVIMVALGLFGVLWQNITRRTQEIGLRRAIGASAMSVHQQIIGELMMLAAFGILAGLVLAIQVPLLGLFPELDWFSFWVSFAIAVAVILSLSFVCALYPSKMATRIDPAYALHYE
ncbi:ABC transporter permease [Pleionea sp. CnH1-48]|uniref:ABC transporter permease n=1 Tax=Pleionea sp. CnH1-48 TaxID=2954494 RepID=UPI0020981EF4|nr:FtsX-like permease family protein [Pleionea sp. CnH1-48]MCO7226036.1 FtsX-like permease family protein [Pleionea sp. CnH1-48]